MPDIPGAAISPGPAMNRLTANLALPIRYPYDQDAPRRRHRIGSFEISASAVSRFNDLLGALGHDRPVERDPLVTAARSLCSVQSSADMPACIRQRLWRVKAAVSMAADRRWDPPHAVVEVVRRVSAYVASNDDLIPDRIPTVGRLDDAIAVDAAWRTVGGEVLDYLDFRRLRRLVAGDRRQWLAFDRERWMKVRQEEQALQAQRARVRASSYLPGTAALFRVA